MISIKNKNVFSLELIPLALAIHYLNLIQENKNSKLTMQSIFTMYYYCTILSYQIINTLHRTQHSLKYIIITVP